MPLDIYTDPRIRREDHFPLREGAERLQGDPSHARLKGWIETGILSRVTRRRCFLGCTMFGREMHTSEEAVERFHAEVNGENENAD